jgi:hypothetical protein
MAEKRARSKAEPAPKSDQRAQLDRVRRICLSIPSTIEKTSHGEPTFFTPKRVFAMFANNHHGDGHVAMWVPAGAGVQAALIEDSPKCTSGRRMSAGQAGLVSSWPRWMTINWER